MASRDPRGLAWLAYVPIPGLVLAPLLAHPGDRLTRYHAWQGTLHLAATIAAMFLLGLLTLLSATGPYRLVVGLVAGVILLAAVAQMVLGIAGALLGGYPRLRPAWDLAASLRRDG